MNQIASQIKPTLDADETAEYLKCSKAQVEKLAVSGILPGAKIGREWVFVGPDIIEWLRARVASRQDEIKDPEPKSRFKKRRRPPPSLEMAD